MSSPTPSTPSRSLLDVSPRRAPPLDPGFRPAHLANESFRRAVTASGRGEPVHLALERNQGLVADVKLLVFPEGSAHDADSYRVVERALKLLLWAQGGFRLHFSGPAWIAARLREEYSPGGTRAFDVDLIAQRSYGHPFEIIETTAARIPAARSASSTIGGHLDGARIGFDLGASDYKLAAVLDGEPVFSTEIPWNPSAESDFEYHASRIREGLRLAASHLPRVDAIGGSSAGIWVDNQVMVASLFRSLSSEDFETQAKPFFLRLREEWGVPLEVANDGDVTALAGAMSLKTHAILGIAMGSSEAVGYLDREGRITGALNELAFAPADFQPDSPADTWSKDHGIGAMHFSQQAVAKLAPRAGLEYPEDMLLADRLKDVQLRAERGEEGARQIFATIGVYFGYTIPYYREVYDFEHLLVLGRVTSGVGGEILVENARETLAAEFPGISERIRIHVPDEKSRRVGQAVAAASLPEIPK